MAASTSSLTIDSFPDQPGRISAAAVKGYAFLDVENGKPVRWDPCVPITYKINRNKAVPKSELAHIKSAFARVGRALGGVKFVYRGSTTVVPDSVNDAAAAKADIVIAFALPGSGKTRSAMLQGGNNLGMGGFSTPARDGGDGPWIPISANGAVALDSHGFKSLTRGERSDLYLHEIGHVVGLDHIGDRKQVMYPLVSRSSPTTYGKGDLAGLRRLGKVAGCLQVPSRPAKPKFSVSGNNLVVVVPAVKSVSGKARYALNQKGLFAPVATSATRTLRIPLAALYDGTSTAATAFTVSAINSVGQTTGAAASYAFPKVALKTASVLTAHGTSLDLSEPEAVLAGTTVPSYNVTVTGELQFSGTLADGGTFTTALSSGSAQVPAEFGEVTEWTVTGSLTFHTTGSPDQTVDYSGTYTPID